MMQSALIQPHLMAMPNNFGKFSGEDVEKDSKCPRLISRDPSSFLEPVEKDMKRNVPTAPGSSSSSSFPHMGGISSGSEVTRRQCLTTVKDKRAGNFRPRAPHVHSCTGQDSHRSSSSSSSSTSSQQGQQFRIAGPPVHSSGTLVPPTASDPGNTYSLSSDDQGCNLQSYGKALHPQHGSQLEKMGISSHSGSAQENRNLTELNHGYPIGEDQVSSSPALVHQPSTIYQQSQQPFPPSHPLPPSQLHPPHLPPSQLHQQTLPPSQLHQQTLPPSSYSPSTYQPTYPPSYPNSMQQERITSTVGNLDPQLDKWSHHLNSRPSSCDQYTYANSEYFSFEPQYRYLGSGESQQDLLMSFSQPSTLATLPESRDQSQQYGFHTKLDSVPYDSYSQSEHVNPSLSHHQQHYNGRPMGKLDYPRYLENNFQQQNHPYIQNFEYQWSSSTRRYQQHPSVADHQYSSAGPYQQHPGVAHHQISSTGQHPSTTCGSDDENILAGQFQRSLSLTESVSARKVEDSKLAQTDSDVIEIVEHPNDLCVELHEKAVFTCRAFVLNQKQEGDGPCMQWFKGENPLAGAVIPDLVLEDVEEKDQGVYYCIVCHPENDSIMKKSRTARLTIKTIPERSKEPVIVEQPPGIITAVAGEDLTLTIKVIGEEPLSFKWYKDTRELDYCKTASLTLPRAAYTDTGQYFCSVTNHHGSQLSKSFNIRVIKTKAADDASVGKASKQRPTSILSWDGTNISDGFLREVGCAIVHQISNWQKLTAYLGLDHSDLSKIKGQFPQPQDCAVKLLHCWRERYCEDKNLLRVRLARAGINLETMLTNIPSGQSQGAEHIFIDKPRIIEQPQSKQVIYGQEFSLSVKVDSLTHSSSFQWYKNHTRLIGKNDSRLTIKSAVDSDAGEYYCLVANTSGSTDSNIVFVKVINPHNVPQQTHAHETVVGHWSGESSRRNPVQGSVRRGSSSTSLGLFPMKELIERGLVDDDQPRGQGEIGQGRMENEQVGIAGASLVSGKFSSLKDILPPGEKPTITKHPVSQEVEAGDPLTLSCMAVGQGELKYLWYFNGLSLAKESRQEYFINCFTDEDEGVYYCKVSNPWGEENSDMAHVQMKDD